MTSTPDVAAQRGHVTFRQMALAVQQATGRPWSNGQRYDHAFAFGTLSGEQRVPSQREDEWLVGWTGTGPWNPFSDIPEQYWQPLTEYLTAHGFTARITGTDVQHPGDSAGFLLVGPRPLPGSSAQVPAAYRQVAYAVEAATGRKWAWDRKANGYCLADRETVTRALAPHDAMDPELWVVMMRDGGQREPIPHEDRHGVLLAQLEQLGWSVRFTGPQDPVPDLLVIDTSRSDIPQVSYTQLTEAVCEITGQPWAWVPGDEGYTLLSDQAAACLLRSWAWAGDEWAVGFYSQVVQTTTVARHLHTRLIRELSKRGWIARISGFSRSEPFGYLLVGPRADGPQPVIVGTDYLTDAHVPDADLLRPLSSKDAEGSEPFDGTVQLPLDRVQLERAMTAWSRYRQVRTDAAETIARALADLENAQQTYTDETGWLAELHRDALTARDAAEAEAEQQQDERRREERARQTARDDEQYGPRVYAQVRLAESQRTGVLARDWKLHRADCKQVDAVRDQLAQDGEYNRYSRSGGLLRAADALRVLLDDAVDCVVCEPGHALARDERLDEGQREQARVWQAKRDDVAPGISDKTVHAMLASIGLARGMWKRRSGYYVLSPRATKGLVRQGAVLLGWIDADDDEGLHPLPEADREQLTGHLRSQGLTVRWMPADHQYAGFLEVYRMTQAEKRAAREQKANHDG